MYTETMKTDRIYQIGDPCIRARSKRIFSPVRQTTLRLIKQMIRIMQRENLVGIAAPQVGVNRRVFITQPRQTKFRAQQSEGKVVVYINPRIASQSKTKQVAYEGCGSVAHAVIFGKVSRSKTVIIEAQDQYGQPFTMRASGFLARIIQHEYDHLEGIIFLDRIHDTRSLLDREAYLRKQNQ